MALTSYSKPEFSHENIQTNRQAAKTLEIFHNI